LNQQIYAPVKVIVDKETDIPKMSLITTYMKLTKEYSEKYGDKTVVLMMVGSFYEIYGEKTINADGSFTITGSKIEEISKLCDLSIAQKTGQYVMAGFTYTKIDKYLKKLQDAGYTAVVITQDPNNPSNRNVEGIYSPGTFFNADSAEISNNSMCIWIEQVSYMKNKSIVVGIANVDIYTGRVTIFEYTAEDKHNPTTYDELERYISTYKPSEIIMITNFTEKIIDDIINYTGILCKNIHKVILTSVTTPLSLQSSSYLVENARKCEKQTYQREILNKFYKFNIIASFIEYTTHHEYATQAFIFLLQFLYEHNPNLVNKIREPVFDNKSERVILANHSLKQLNIIDDDNYNGKYSSVSKFLNNCITPMGSRRFKNKILNPIFDAIKLNKEYDITEYIINKRGDMLITEWRTNMGELKDIEKLHRQIIHNKVTPRSLFHLYNNMTTISSMYEKMKSDAALMSYVSSELENKKNSYDLQGRTIPDISELCKKLKSFIETHLVLEKCFTIDNLNFEENFICPSVNETLDNIVYDYENSYIELQTIQGYFCDVVSSCEKVSKTEKKYEYVKIHDTEKMGYSLVTTKRRAKLLEEQLKKQLKTTAKTEVQIQYETYKKESNILRLELSGLSYPVATGSNTSIQSTQIDKLCGTIIKSKQKMRIVIENIFTEFIKNIQNNFETDIQIIVDMVTMIDVLQNQVYVALKNKYCKPVIKKPAKTKAKTKTNANANANADTGDDSFVKACDLRHCLIEHLNTNELYVTNDIELGNTTEQNGILLYGTNAVGKTSLIRALGIAIIMAQAGLYVPCSSFEYIPYKSIFTRILGNDNLFKGLSTFMVEMSELRVILKSANNYGLILGDELCSGTEMDSAISIFVAGLKQLHDVKCSFIFATHMHEINKYEEVEAMDRLSMKHLEVTYNKERDILVYDRKLKDGPGFSMYGLEVCRSLHLPEDFLKYANEIRLKYRNNEQSILSAKQSKYNAKKIRNICEMCNNEMGTEIHHLQHQKNADQRNFIGHFHKNHVANLVSICEKCHDMVHSNGEQHRKVMTSTGPIIIKM
jgi:DNA mismatch repair protein MutS